MSNIIESEVGKERDELIQTVSNDAARVLGVSGNEHSSLNIVTAVNECIINIKKGKLMPELDDEEPNLLLGCLWGNQFIKELEWGWVNIDAPDFKDVAVVSPTRSMAIYPFSYISHCLENKIPSTVLLAFNMIIEKTDDEAFEPKSYENVMNHIFHIVEPEY